MSRIKSLFGVQGLIYILVSFILVFFGFRSPDVVDDFNIYWMMTGSSFVLGVMGMAQTHIHTMKYTHNAYTYVGAE